MNAGEPDVVYETPASAACCAKFIVACLAAALLATLVWRGYMWYRAKQWRNIEYSDGTVSERTFQGQWGRRYKVHLDGFHMWRLKSEPDVYRFRFQIPVSQWSDGNISTCSFQIEFADTNGVPLAATGGRFDLTPRHALIDSVVTFPRMPRGDTILHGIALSLDSVEAHADAP